LGRETALQKVVWKEDGWPYPESQLARNVVSFTGATVPKTSRRSFFDDFDGPRWNSALMSLRVPLGADADLTTRPGWLRLVGRASPVSPFEQRVLACRVRAFRWEAQTTLDFHPTNFQHLAGLIVRYDERHQAYARVTWDEERQTRTLGLLAFDGGHFTMPLDQEEIDVGHSGILRLRVAMDHRDLKFSWSGADGDWTDFGPTFDTARFSDEHSWPLAFTGLFVGVAVHDLSGTGQWADFDRFSYTELGEASE
jgi:xylan 1,4-beta-xylosidase